MKCISLLLFTMIGLSAADAMTVDPSGKVGIGTATPTSTLDVAGTTTATNVIVKRTSQAAATEAVRGDDPRMTNARPANGGNAATVGGLAPSAFVATTEKGAANGVATLNASGQIPAAQLPIIPSGRGIQFFTQSGTFSVPAGVTELQVIALGGGGGGWAPTYGPRSTLIPSPGGGAGAFAWVKLTNLSPSYTVTVGAAGTARGGAGGQTSFGIDVLCGGGTNVGGTGSTTGQGIVIPGASGASGANGGAGASSHYGNGGSADSSATGYGAGGLGATTGLPGTPGLCIVMW